MLNEDVDTNAYQEALEDFAKYAARFLLLVGEDQPSSSLFREIVDFMYDNAPTLPIVVKVKSGYINEAKDLFLKEAGLASLTPEELAAFDSLLARDKTGLSLVTRKIKDELGQRKPNLTKIVSIISGNKTDGTPEPAPTPAGPAADYYSKIDDLLRGMGPDPKAHFDNLKSKFYNYVKNSYKRFGKQSFIDANPRLSDEFPDKQPARGQRISTEPRGQELSDAEVLDMLSNDNYYVDAGRIDAIADQLKDAVEEKEGKLQETMAENFKLTLDLNEVKRLSKLDESFMLMFRTWIKIILKFIFGDVSFPVQVKGSPSEVAAFGKAITGEKKYIDSIKKYGLNNRQTYSSRAQLASSIRNFERETGLKWPFV